MGSVWSIFQDDRQLFDKSAHLRYPSTDSELGDSSDADGYSSRFAYYQTLKQAIARMELTRARRSSLAGGTANATPDEADMEPDDRAHVNFMLAHWPREVDVVYDRHDEFPFTIAIERELDADIAAASARGGDTVVAASDSAAAHLDRTAVTTQEEAILKGLCENKLSSSEAIHHAIEQLRDKLGDSNSDTDQFLRVLAKYPRAARLFASQQLHARSDVERAFRLYALKQDYARAAHTAGKLAYGEEASRVKKKLQRLKVMSTLLQRSLGQHNGDSASSKSSHSIRRESTGTVSSSTNTNATATAAAAAQSGSTRAKDSFDQVMTDEMIALLQRQSDLQAALGVEYLVGSSLIETLHKLFALYPTHPAAFAMAVDVAEQFEVHPRQFSWALLKVLAQTEQWQSLLIVSAVARPAIGFVPVIELLLDEDHVDLAHDLLALIDAPHEREEITALLGAYHAHNSTSGDNNNNSSSASLDNHSTGARHNSTGSIQSDGYYVVSSDDSVGGAALRP